MSAAEARLGDEECEEEEAASVVVCTVLSSVAVSGCVAADFATGSLSAAADVCVAREDRAAARRDVALSVRAREVVAVPAAVGALAAGASLSGVE